MVPLSWATTGMRLLLGEDKSVFLGGVTPGILTKTQVRPYTQEQLAMKTELSGFEAFVICF